MADRLLPPSASPLEVQLEQAMAYFEEGRQVPIDTLWDPARCPPPLLPWLAWALGVRWWRDEWNVATKRAVIAASIGLHRAEGTNGAVREMLDAMGVIYVLTEYQGPPMSPPRNAYFVWLRTYNLPDVGVTSGELQGILENQVGRLSCIYRIREISTAHGEITVGGSVTATVVVAIGGGA